MSKPILVLGALLFGLSIIQILDTLEYFKIEGRNKKEKKVGKRCLEDTQQKVFEWTKIEFLNWQF